MKRIKSFRQKILISLSLVIVISILVFYNIQTKQLFKLMRKERENSLIQSLNFVEKSIELKEKEVMVKCIAITEDNRISDLLNIKGGEYKLSFIISNYIKNFPGTYIEVFNKDKKILAKSYNGFYDTDIKTKKYIINKALKKKVLLSDIVQNKSSIYIRNIVSILEGGESIGGVIYYEKLSNAYLDSLKTIFKLDINLYNKKDEIVASTSFNNLGERNKKSHKNKKNLVIIEDKNNLYCYKHLKDKDLGIELLYPLLKYNIEKTKLSIKMVYISLILIILSILLFNTIIYKLTRPLNLLINAFEKISEDDFDYKIDYKSSDEIGLAISKFNMMVKKLKNKKEREKRIYNLNKIASLGRLSASVAHEIKNPLSSIAMIVDMYYEQFESINFEKKDFELISREIKRINGIIEKLVDFSRNEKIEVKRVNILEIIEEMLHLLNKKAKEKGIEFILNLKEDIFINADLNLMKQMLINLFINSIEAMDGGYIEIKIEKVGNKLSLLLKDNGCGISEKVKDKIMEPFFSTKLKGSGIGLSVVKKILDIHEFSYKIESEKGLGTSFYIFIDLEKNAEIELIDMDYDYEILERRD